MVDSIHQMADDILKQTAGTPAGREALQLYIEHFCVFGEVDPTLYKEMAENIRTRAVYLGFTD